MAKQADKVLNEEERKAIFLALVRAQDTMSVARSRKAVAADFGIAEEQVRRIEEEGLAAGWPPLD
jgi:hypothetical protein